MPEWAVATPHRAATEAARRTFEAGGNAIDAALAAAAVLTVAYPANCALGGDLFALVRDGEGRTVSVNASGPAGRGADAAVLRARADGMPVHGPDTVTVPGLVAGWGELHRLGAALPWAGALEAATALAADGVPVAPGLAADIAAAPGVRDDAGMRAVFAPGGEPLRAGDTLRQPALAATLARLAADGPRALYEGDVAEQLLAGLRALGGTLVAEDLREFTPEVGAPLTGRFRDLDVLTSPPNSSGILVLQALAALDAAALADPLGADAGALAEILRAGAQDRDRLLGDPRVTGFDPDAWLGADRVEALVRRARAVAAGQLAVAASNRTARPAGDTVAVVTRDGEGRAVSLIQSLFHGFGAQILEPATGVLLHNRGAFFTLDEGHPNVLAPGKRPAHTLMPIMVERGGRLLGVLGTMGGKVHAQIHVQVLLRLLAGQPPYEAVDAPRWIVGGMEVGEPDHQLRVEDGTEQVAVAALARAGLPLLPVPRRSETFGHAQAIWLDSEVGAGSDFRADGAAAVG